MTSEIEANFADVAQEELDVILSWLDKHDSGDGESPG